MEGRQEARRYYYNDAHPIPLNHNEAKEKKTGGEPTSKEKE